MKYNDVFLYKLLRPLVCLIVAVAYRPVRKGLENIPKEGPVVLAGNHTSYFDSILLMSSTPRHVHFLAKKELWKFPWGILFSNMGLIPVDRSKKSHDSLEHAYKYLENNKVVLVFPEGTTRKTVDLLPFKPGAAKIAQHTSSKIVPFVIRGKYGFWSRIEITFLDPIEVGDDIGAATMKLETIVGNKLREK